MEGVRRLIGVRSGPLPADRIDGVRIGTTVATNALLERAGEPTLLAITAGHGDALRIGYQNRPRLFDLHIRLPETLYAAVVEIDERMGAQGEVIRPFDPDSARARLKRAFDDGLRAVAVVLMHGYRYADHEAQVAALAREIGFTQVSVSHEVSALVKLIARGETTVADAYLSPALARYVDAIAADLGARDGAQGPRLLFMQSSGALVEARRFRGRDAILSGPAGGIVGMAKTAQAAGFAKVIGFDMGGTSTDVSHYAGAYERTFDAVVAGVRVRAPMMQIHTVAAGGGSICSFEGGRLRVGPQSAGADPGPACYRRGGPLTLTDCNLLLGKLQPHVFPKVFGPTGDQPLDAEAVRARFEALATEVSTATGRAAAPTELAEGFVTIAVENMANAIKRISVQRGYDVADYVLACFGGAAGQHACQVADALGVQRILVHPLAGVLSAYGMGLADLGELREATVERPLDAALIPDLGAQAEALEADARTALAQAAAPDAAVTVTHAVQIKYAGTDAGLAVPLDRLTQMHAAFEAAHRRRFGFIDPSRSLVVETIKVEAVAASGACELDLPLAAPGVAPQPQSQSQSQPLAEVDLWTYGRAWAAPLYARADLPAGFALDGPAIVSDPASTTVVEPGWRAEVTARGDLLLARAAAPAFPEVRSNGFLSTAVDPVRLEVFNNLFMTVAEQMGVALQTTAYSVNIKERLDFSCALFAGDGALIANAPHIPVHLGSMGEAVKTVIESRGAGRDAVARDGRRLRPGDAYMLNAPYRGGTHLPDVTVIMPVFLDQAAEADPAFYVAARGHHADIGGVTPGSMPPLSRSVEEEGVLIDDVLLVDAGRFREAETRALLGGGAYPARNPDQNVGDLKAQVAACVRGSDELRRICSQYGLDVVQAYMGHVQDNAEAAVRRAIARLRDGAFTYELDDGAVISVRIAVDAAQGRATVDFTGTSVSQPTNFNAPSSICRAAVMYVFRTLVEDDIPLNDGCLRPIEIVVPEGSMLRPRYPAAVVAGNVETSQAVTDALYGALGLLAGAQGTMNNFTFGDEERQYYETICGGSGAGPGFAGASAVQTHMTNSRLTDPEVLEARYPVLVERFAIRRGSGGRGRWPGGDGVERHIAFRAPMTAAILSNRRRVPPFGLAGGAPGACGRNRVERRDGSVDPLGSTAVIQMSPGDVFVIETPGGGGFGSRDGG